MILPSKHLPQGRALLTIGAAIIAHLSRPTTVSALWEQMPRDATGEKVAESPSYDAFVLALDLLFLMGAVEVRDGLLVRGGR